MSIDPVEKDYQSSVRFFPEARTEFDLLTIIVLLLLAMIPWGNSDAADPVIRIGVLSHRGNETTLKNWSPTADYLSESVPGKQFEIVPLDFMEVDLAVQFGEVDFLLVNPGIYVNMEVKYRVSRIATLNNLVGNTPHNVFGGVIFTRKGRQDINRIEDLRGKRLMAVDETSLGGFQMAWRELNAVGLDPYRDIQQLTFGGIHDQVVMAVFEGLIDVGTVRTNILERMASDGQIDMRDFRIIAPRMHTEFPFARSTRLYPEWPFSQLQHTPTLLAQQVAVALLNMPKAHPAAKKGNYAGWTVPLDYQQVHELFRELKLPPYDAVARFTLSDAMHKYWYWMVIGVSFLLAMAFMTTWVARLNRALAKSKLHLERQHELILNSVADGIYGVSLEGKTTFVNRAMEEITGWSAEELIGANQHEILHHTRGDGTAHPAEECPVYITFRDSAPRFVDDDLFWKKDRSSFPVEYSTTPIKNDTGSTIGSVVVFRDISERKTAQEEARQHQMDLAHVARFSTMGEMASGIAHEINQPLTAIATNAHACIRMLESGSGLNRCADVMEKIGAQAERAGEIIRQLRQFVRKEEPERVVTDINDLIREVVVLIKPEIDRSDVRLIQDLDAGIGRVLVQNIQIEQVILNLARNAVEAMSETVGGSRRLVLRTRSGEENTVVVSVMDSGPGLDESVRDQLFNPFITTKPKGVGLGLSISLGIIEAHQGNLYLDSSSGEGAVFRFSLPVFQA